MKKLLGVILVALLVLVGCGKTETPDNGGAGTGKTYKIGVGIVVDESGTDATDAAGKLQVDTAYAMVVLDGDVIVDVYIDTSQSYVEFDTTDALVNFEGAKTKKELGDDYNMKKFGNAVAEWFEQIESLEDYMIGKTVNEVLGMPTYQRDDAHPSVPDVEDLKSSVTITVETYLAAVKKAAENAVSVDNVDKIAISSITSAERESLEINTVINALAVDSNDNIVYAFIDTAQNSANLEGGVITLKNMTRTKKELGDDYNMKKFGGAVAEWYEQIASLENYMVGKKVADVVSMELKDGVSQVEDLKSTVTIAVPGYLGAVEKTNTKLKAVR